MKMQQKENNENEVRQHRIEVKRDKKGTQIK
jgi:hypothetical protein